MKNENNISVVTCSMNRHGDLIETLKSTNNLKNMKEHLVVDWSSSNIVPSEFSNYNNKLRVVRVESEKDWWLTRAYNFGVYVASGNIILKLDADTSINTERFNTIDLDKLSYLNLTYENNGYGNFIIKKKLFEEVNGFNEYIYGWGYDDFDFHNRVMKLTGSQKRGEDFITVKKHGASKSFDQQLDNKKVFSALKLAHHKKNRYISQNTNWELKHKKIYHELSNNNYTIKHFFSVKSLNFMLKTNTRVLFYKVFINEYFKINISKYLKIFIILIPQNLIYLLYKVRIFPKKEKT
jgi:GT2 family glycosyltransferase